MTNNQLRDISSSATYLFWRGSDYRFIISQILDFEESILSDEIKQMIINRNYIYNLGLRNKFPIQEFMDNIYKIIDEYIQVYISDRVYWSIENYGINYTNNFQNWITHYCKIKQLLQQFLLGCEKYNFESNLIPNNMIFLVKFQDDCSPNKLDWRYTHHLLKCIKTTPKMIKYQYTEQCNLEIDSGQFKRSAVEEIYLLPNIISDTEFIMFSRIIYQSDFRFSHFMNEYNKIQKFNNKQDWFNFIDFI
tara:strand:+ start:73 stop:816 length:744 start_codon:yes stop_codon:yes gene_type:complete